MTQHLAAIRALCDWLVVHHVLPGNPAAAVRGPKHVVTRGATPVLTPAETPGPSGPAMKEARKGGLPQFASMQALLDDLHADD